MIFDNLQTLKYINGILTLKSVEKYIPVDKMCVDLVGLHYLRRYDTPKSIIKVFTITNPDIGWF